MNKSTVYSGCAYCGLNRRQFLAAGCVACAGTTGLLTSAKPARAAEDKKLRIQIIYSLHAPQQSRPDWPNVGFDFQPPMDKITGEVKRRCPDIEFTTAMANGAEATKKIIEADKFVDGYLIYQMNCWNRVMQTAVGTGKPTLYADFQYGGSGGFLVYTAGMLRNDVKNFGFVASSNVDDLIAAINCFKQIEKAEEFGAAVARVRKAGTPKAGDLSCKADQLATLTPDQCIAQMKKSKMITVGHGWPNIVDAIQSEMGIEVIDTPYSELNAAWEAADKDKSIEIAERWQKSATKVEGVTRETLIKSAAMYLAQKALLKKHGANAITINCLGGFYGGHIHAYPCLAHHELANEGLIGACECDKRSTATMIAMTAMTKGRPGFISDPVIDTASRQIIYAHCVAGNKAFGPKGTTNPFEILTHSEDRQGASVRSKLPVGYMTTTVEFAPERKMILFHQGKAVGNSTDDRACRTKLVAEPVGDIEKLFTEWDKWGWHRVTVYGDLKEPVYALAERLKWKVLEEA